MKIDDLSLSPSEISSIADKILKCKEEPVGDPNEPIGYEVNVIVNDIESRISKELFLKIQYTQAPLSKSLRVKRFWGHHVFIDINGMKEKDKRKSKKEVHSLIVEGLNEYLSIASNTPYGHVDIDNLK